MAARVTLSKTLRYKMMRKSWCSESLRLIWCLFLVSDGIMVNYVLLAVVLTFAWVLYAAFRVAPMFAKRWKAWGEVFAFLIFTAVELGFLVAFLRP